MRGWLVGLLAGLLGFGLARWTVEVPLPPTPGSGADAPAGASGAAARVRPAAALPTVSIDATPTPVVAAPAAPAQARGLPEAPAADAPALALDAVTFLREWPAQLDDLATRAQAGEARALIELAEAIDYCNTARGAITRARLAAASVGNLADASVQAYLTEVDELCKAFMQRTPWLAEISRDAGAKFQQYLQAMRENRFQPDTPRPPASAADSLRSRAADAGDVVAEGLTNDDDVRRSCGVAPNQPVHASSHAVALCIHAAAHERVAAILARRDPREIEAVPRILAAMSPQLLTGSEFIRANTPVFDEITVRWILTACEFGLDCGPASHVMRRACASSGACGYRHYRDYAADRLLPPATMRLINGQVPRLVNLILAGDVDGVIGPPPRNPAAGRP